MLVKVLRIQANHANAKGPKGRERKSGGERYWVGVRRYSSFQLTFLGTSSAKPTRERNVTAMCLQTDHWAWMFDCGEATQHQILKHKIRRTKLEKIFLTHLHGDHSSY
eukprot:TRINITY_DN2710_c0_g1_i4.p1 TRINITY_DN2710_c0_g1~~TRINITY_DN2710_c0_g1_i4.p1  ORF type:complete len:108 (-),score=18.48 TRINITY_DN2710_c0_g1_i4:797-1120(-)